ncbi:MAG: hypothetical protein ACOC0Y_02205 [Spirochaetota bacterium]
MRRFFTLLVFGLVFASFGWTQEWQLRRFTDPAAMRETTDELVADGFVPASIDVSEEFGITMLFTRLDWWTVTAYRVEEIASLSDLTETVSGLIEEGWLPMDLSFQDDQYVLLAVDAAETLDGWRVVSSEAELVTIQSTLSAHRSDGFQPVGISATGRTEIAYLLLGMPERDFGVPAILGVPHDPHKAAEAIQSMVDAGWYPLSITTTSEEIVVLFVD